LKYLDALFLLRAIPDFLQICKDALKQYPGDADLSEQLEEGEDIFSSHVAQIKGGLQARGMTLVRMGNSADQIVPVDFT
jgi:hypothetical protein